MKLFWYDEATGRGVPAEQARAVTLLEAERTWTDEVRGVEGSFLGLIDDADRTIQFMFERDLANHETSSHFVRIIRVDFPCPERKGSFTALLTGSEALRWMSDAFANGADPARFDGLSFELWGR